ncbi:flagellar protein FlgN [Vibrio sp. WXL103]|uniref:flagellar protein FlgN n=1 Tax=unclassified Vibrio TaxID=2614977 RepID=UPI003EC73672
MSKTAIIKAFIQGVQADVQDYQTLLKVMRSQHEWMTKRESQRLEAAAGKQQKFLAKLTGRAEERSKMLEQIGVSADATGVKRLIAALPSHVAEPLQASWNKLHHLVNECQVQNERNGKLLTMQQSILTELTQPASVQTYAPE